MKILQKGAEANILLEKNKVIKDRIKKSYRIQQLDNKLKTSRTKREFKIIKKISGIIPAPNIISTNNKDKIEMEYIKGEKLSKNLDSLPNSIDICKQIGKQIAKLHDSGIIHGDLTTSNMIYVSHNDKKNKISNNTSSPILYFIDFGLAFHSDKTEDKAVDLHLIKQALEAKHFLNYEKFFTSVLEGYKTSPQHEKVLERLKKVESRGRYKKLG